MSGVVVSGVVGTAAGRRPAARYTIPHVVERTPTGERSFDVFSRLLDERVVMLGTEIDDAVAGVVTAQLLHLDSASSDSEIGLYINSPGGAATAMTAIYDTMQFVRAPVATYCLGQAASAAAVLFAAGAPGRRSMLAHARIVLHPPSSQSQGTISDLALAAAEVARLRDLTDEILAEHTGRDAQEWRADTGRDRVYTPHEAIEFGLADRVVTRRP